MSLTRSLLVVCSLTAAMTPAQTANWLHRSPAVAPAPGSFNVAMAYDSARNQTVLFITQIAQTWVYDGVNWTQQSPAQSPTRDGAICFDSVRNVVVGVFGNQSTGLETWEWNGTNWSLRMTGGLPARGSFMLAFDSVRNQTVLFGGNDGGRSWADTWTWDGSTWTQRSTGGATGRSTAGMAFDQQRGVVVLFGGFGPLYSQEIYLGSTWEWNGSYWYEHFNVPGPAARRAPGMMVYDSRRGRTVLHGGSDNNQYQDTWEWNGAAWTQVPTTLNAPSGNAMAFDEARGVCVLFREVTSTATETWEYVASGASPPAWSVFGQGCSGPSGVPAIGAVGGSLPRLGQNFQVALTNLPPSPFNLPFGVLGYDATSWNNMSLPVSLDPYGFTGCQAWIAPAISVTLANASGTAPWSIAIPLDLDLIGIHFFLQGAVLVPGWNAGGMVFSNAGHGVVGNP